MRFIHEVKTTKGDKKLPVIKNYRTATTTKCVIQYKFVSKLPDRQEFWLHTFWQ